MSSPSMPYTHWSMIKLPVPSPLKITITESFPTCLTPTRSHQL